MAVYRTTRDYLILLLIICVGLYTIYRGYHSQLEVTHLRNELQQIKINVNKDTHQHINEVIESHKETNQQLQMLKDLLSKITSKTNEFAMKVPELEGIRID